MHETPAAAPHRAESARNGAERRISGAFTLIELLIVVAILAILAAVALPNFLEAQVRSKVSRVRADMRSIATAAEAYHVDNNRYPYVADTLNSLDERMRQLTTPIAFLTSIPRDPFVRRSGSAYGFDSAEDPSGASYLYNTGNVLVGPGVSDPNNAGRQGWSLTSGGPDTLLEFPYWPFAETFIISNQHLNFIYDPTNGAVSRGEVFRRGGRALRPIPQIDSQ
ncbi:MAG: type II secretion system protein GspG [Candidatus Sumerlaeia bacterium]|nr:type II secretion system protein GspG [Candidatus Sumerlaeia bacterium]